MGDNEARSERTFVGTHAAHLRERYIRCGKPNCTKCPHGPYTYLTYRAGSTVKTEYIGKSERANKRQPKEDERKDNCGI